MAYNKKTFADYFSNTVEITTWDDGSIFFLVGGRQVCLPPAESETVRAFLDLVPGQATEAH